MSSHPDPEAAAAHLSELFTRHGAAMLGLCRVLLRQREEAEDAVQQTFLAAYRSLLNGVEPRNPAAWLATIARNECWGRIQHRMREPLAEPDLESLPDPVAAAADRADLSALWQAIGELPRQQRDALLLREFSGLSYVELAAALGVSKPAVESLLFRARHALRVRLQPVYGSAAVTPLTAVRDALARAIGGMPDPSSVGPLAKIAAAPLLAKLVAGTAAVVVAGGTIAAVDHHARTNHHAAHTLHSSTLPLAIAGIAPVHTPAARSVAREVVAPIARVGHAIGQLIRRVSGNSDDTAPPQADTQSSGSNTSSSPASDSSGDNVTTDPATSGDSATTAATTTTTAADSSGDASTTANDTSGDTTTTTPPETTTTTDTTGDTTGDTSGDPGTGTATTN